MQRWLVPLLIVITLTAPAAPLIAQEGARGRIAAAVEEVATWETFQVALDDSCGYVVTAQGRDALLWQRHSQSSALSGVYDFTGANPIARLTLTGRATTATDHNSEASQSTWDVALDVAAVGGDTFWQGTFKAIPEDGFEVPATWEPFDARDIAQVPWLADLGIVVYLERDALAGDAESWLSAARSITGPEMVAIDRSTRGELYTVELALADTPELLRDSFWSLTGGKAPVVEPEILHKALLETSTLTWRVVLDPATGRLLLQSLELALSAKLGPEDLESGFRSLSLEASRSQTTVYSAVNEPLAALDLPG